jgi:hypothetical protein
MLPSDAAEDWLQAMVDPCVQLGKVAPAMRQAGSLTANVGKRDKRINYAS